MNAAEKTVKIHSLVVFLNTLAIHDQNIALVHHQPGQDAKKTVAYMAQVQREGNVARAFSFVATVFA